MQAELAQFVFDHVGSARGNASPDLRLLERLLLDFTQPQSGGRFAAEFMRSFRNWAAQAGVQLDDASEKSVLNEAASAQVQALMAAMQRRAQAGGMEAKEAQLQKELRDTWASLDL